MRFIRGVKEIGTVFFLGEHGRHSRRRRERLGVAG